MTGATAPPPALSLRAALAELRAGPPGAVVEHDEPADRTRVADHFARAYAGVPARGVSRPEPAVLYTAVPGGPVLLGLYGDEERLRRWLPGLPERAAPETAARLVAEAVRPNAAPVAVSRPPCQEHRTTGARVDLSGLPVPVLTPRDAGPYLTAALVRAEDPATGRTALSAHRMLVVGRDRLTVWMVPGRQVKALYEQAVREGRPLPVTVNIGVPPAAMVASALNTRFLPDGLDKLAVAGALAGRPLAVAPALTQPVSALAEAEIVLEGYLDGSVADEALPGAEPRGSLPEFLGFDGGARPGLPVLTVTAVTHRSDPVFQAVIGPGREQSAVLGAAGALSAALSLRPVLPRAEGVRVRRLHFAAAGGGMLLLAVAVRKESAAADGGLAVLARELLERHPFVKLVVFTDDDVDVGCAEDLLWALVTRSNLGADATAWPRLPPVPMDPSQTPDWAAVRHGAERPPGRVSVDATTPYALRSRTARSFRPEAGLAATGHCR
ncbi:UbiD family decarboxylase [Streptomyces sp. XD-27]|uniref:UbiD family decarboxylase n=1 Tax=Streptomyces sp. XD-27 TaxID=3062779 RepID=UPI0026F44BB7|nr:UbiD family decarboxylase [Streptomyces sp. XD-27]WKX69270.1 UbiD family decarboxylase [Streptomyces sp. XD-27]